MTSSLWAAIIAVILTRLFRFHPTDHRRVVNVDENVPGPGILRTELKAQLGGEPSKGAIPLLMSRTKCILQTVILRLVFLVGAK